MLRTAFCQVPRAETTSKCTICFISFFSFGLLIRKYLRDLLIHSAGCLYATGKSRCSILRFLRYPPAQEEIHMCRRLACEEHFRSPFGDLFWSGVNAHNSRKEKPRTWRRETGEHRGTSFCDVNARTLWP